MNKLCKILIVDDELIMRQGIAHMIDWEKEGYQIIGQASNGEDAIEFINKIQPDIILTDVVMPKIDGIELTKFIQKNYPQIKIIILSSYSDFEYVKSSFQNGAVDYILKPSLNINDLLSTLKKASKNIADSDLPSSNTNNYANILKRLLLGFNSDINYQCLNNLFSNKNFCFFGMNLNKLYDNYETRKELIDLFQHQMKLQFNDTDEIISNIISENEIIITLINFNIENYTQILNKLHLTAKNISLKFDNAFFVLSKNFSSLTYLKTVYDEDFLILTKQYFYNKNINFLSSYDYKQPVHIDSFNFKYFSELISKTKINDAFELLTQYINKALLSKSLNEFELKTLIQNSFYNVISTLESLGFDESKANLLKHSCFEKIEKTLYAEDLFSYYQNLVCEFKKIFAQYESQFNSDMISKIIDYINTHYSEPLTLLHVSKIFNFNYYYLSSYFASYTKEGFNEYLNKIRIEKACDFLKEDIPISSISGMVGYSDQSYFSKVFKKFIGTTPTDFRKKTLKQKKGIFNTHVKIF